MCAHKIIGRYKVAFSTILHSRTTSPTINIGSEGDGRRGGYGILITSDYILKMN